VSAETPDDVVERFMVLMFAAMLLILAISVGQCVVEDREREAQSAKYKACLDVEVERGLAAWNAWEDEAQRLFPDGGRTSAPMLTFEAASARCRYILTGEARDGGAVLP
jgi:hypothetical protein